MSVAALSYSKFCSEAPKRGRVYTFTNCGELLVYPVRGEEVVPFWSSRGRLEKITVALPKYQRFEITEYSWSEFEDWLSQLEEASILVGVNWAGAKLTGYNVSVPNLKAAMKNHSDKDA